MDYRKLNTVTVKDSYPLPRIDEALDQLSGACFFSTLDLTSGYWQVEFLPDDRPRTAFVTQKGLYEFSVMPFGLVNAPATLQRLMERVISGLQLDTCLVYLDDIIVFSQSFDEHLDKLQSVFSHLRNVILPRRRYHTLGMLLVGKDSNQKQRRWRLLLRRQLRLQSRSFEAFWALQASTDDSSETSSS